MGLYAHILATTCNRRAGEAQIPSSWPGSSRRAALVIIATNTVPPVDDPVRAACAQREALAAAAMARNKSPRDLVGRLEH